MHAVFFTLMALAMAAVLGVLFLGVFSMAKGGAFNKKYGNRLMQARVWCQGLAIAFFLLAILVGKS